VTTSRSKPTPAAVAAFRLARCGLRRAQGASFSRRPTPKASHRALVNDALQLEWELPS
jgi:hypothetical protein